MPSKQSQEYAEQGWPESELKYPNLHLHEPSTISLFPEHVPHWFSFLPWHWKGKQFSEQKFWVLARPKTKASDAIAINIPSGAALLK